MGTSQGPGFGRGLFFCVRRDSHASVFAAYPSPAPSSGEGRAKSCTQRSRSAQSRSICSSAKPSVKSCSAPAIESPRVNPSLRRAAISKLQAASASSHRLERRRGSARTKRACAFMQIFARAFGHARERRTETLGEFLRERLRRRSPDDDEVVAQPEQGPRQRSGIRLRHKIDRPLALGLDRNRLEGSKSAPGLLLHACRPGDIEPLRKSCEQLEKELRKNIDQARGDVEPESIRTLGQTRSDTTRQPRLQVPPRATGRAPI